MESLFVGYLRARTQECFTLEGWVLIKEITPERNRFFGKYGGPIESVPTLWMEQNGTIVFSALCNGAIQESRAQANSIATRIWFHLAGTFDEDKLRLYVDEQLQLQEECPTPNWLDNLAFHAGGFSAG